MRFYPLRPVVMFFVFASSLLFPTLICGQGVSIANPLTANSVTELLDTIINFIFMLALGIAPIMIIVAGFLFITAQGMPDKIDTAKKIILWVLIGLLIVFCSKGLIKLFKDVFTQ